MKPSYYYLLGAVVLAALLVPLYASLQTPLMAEVPLEEEPVEEPSKLDDLINSMLDRLTGEDVIIVTCNGKWTGMMRLKTIEGTRVQALHGTGDKTITVTGDLKYVHIEGNWFWNPVKDYYIGLEIRINGVTVYKQSGHMSYSWQSS